MGDCLIRPSQRPGLRMRDMPPNHELAALQVDGTWKKLFRGPRFEYEPVEIVGPSIEAIAEFIQRLREQAPELDGPAAVDWSVVNAGTYSTLDRQIVLELFVILRQDWPNETLKRPLPSVSLVIRRWFDDFYRALAEGRHEWLR